MHNPAWEICVLGKTADERLIMKKTVLLGAMSLTLIGLIGCIHVDEGDWSDSEEIARNTETALRVCGGPGTVAEVTENGYTCKED
jgi:hypothetical protein